MKSIAIIAALFAATAVAGPMPVWKDGVTRTYWPREIVWPDGRVTVGANVAQCIAAGAARWETETEWTAREAAEAQAAQEAAEQAAYEASLPVPMPTGVEVPWVVFLDATNRTKGIAMELTTNNVPIYYEFHASPVDWKKVDANRKAALSAAAAKEKDSADAIAYAKDKAAKDGVAKAEAVAATDGKEPSDKEKIALMWKHYLAVVGVEKK